MMMHGHYLTLTEDSRGLTVRLTDAGRKERAEFDADNAESDFAMFADLFADFLRKACHPCGR